MSDGKEKNSRNLKENVMKMIYIEMLGQNADFGHMEAVRLVNRPDQKSILLKRIGYLAASLVLDDQDQLVILLVNTYGLPCNSALRADLVTLLTNLIGLCCAAESTKILAPTMC